MTDPSNAVVANAAITMTSVDTGFKATTNTSPSGSYRFPLVKPGNYKINISMPGFRRVESVVAVSIGQITTMNIQLQVGQSSETVEVSGAAPLIQTEDANMSTSYSQQQLAALPAPGGDITSYAYTAPGVVVSNGAGYGNFSSFGLPSTSNLFTTNGNDNMDPFLNVNNSGATNLSLGSNELQEIAVIANGYTAQYGRQAGAQVNASTKSGSNAFHGNASYNYNGTNLNANDWFANATTPRTPRPHAVNNAWAASIGGPIIKNKLFFFVDQEGIRFVLPGASGVQTVPTDAFANFVLGNVGAASQPFYKNIFNLYAGAAGASAGTPVSTAGGGDGGCGDFTGGGFGPGGTPCAKQFNSTANNLIHEWILSTRVDYKISSSDTLFGRYKMDRGVQATGTDPINPVFNATSIQPQYEGQLNETHIFNNTTINNLIISGSWYKALFGPPDFAAATAAFPTTMVFGDGFFDTLGGADNAYPQGRIVTQYQITDDFSKSIGSHDIKVGLNFRRNLVSDYSALAGTTGTLNILSMTEFANGVLDAANPASFYTSNFSNVGAVKVKLYSVGFYVQDQWKMTSKLNVTLALRLDRNSNPVCDHCFNRMIGSFQNVTHDVNTPYDQTIATGLSSAFSSVEKVAFSPRVGFAYNLKRDTVIRGGFGIFDDLFPATLVDRFITNAPSVSTFSAQSPGAPISFDVPGNLPAQAAASNATFQQQFSSGLTVAGLGGPGAGPAFYTMNDKLSNPKFAEWNFEVQQGLGNKYSVGLNYVGNHGYDIITINPWLNAFCQPFDAVNNPGGCKPGQTFGGQIGTNPTDPRFNEIVNLTNDGYANYHGLTASFRMQPVHGFSGQLNYTWSHALDSCSNNCLEPFVANTLVSLRYQTSPLLPGSSYGNADYDVRQNINLNYVYNSPSTWSSSAMKYLLGGWTVAGTLFYHTGIPWSPVDLASRSELGNVTGLRNATPLATFIGAPSGLSCGEPAAKAGAGLADGVPCVDASQFAVGTLGFGNFARNTMRGSGFFNTDLSLSKGFNLTERFRFAVGANFFNILNHQNFDLPVNSVTSGQFGQSISTIGSNTNPYGAFFGVPLNGRIVQVFAKLTF